jgi:hypothetical protein
VREDRLEGSDDKDDEFALERQQAGAAAVSAAAGPCRRQQWRAVNREKGERGRSGLRQTATSCGKGRQRGAA